MKTNLLHAHGSPTRYQRSNHGCKCASCRGAENAYSRRRYASNPAQRTANAVRLRQFNYGISAHEYERRAEAQGNVCAICGNAQTAGRYKYLSVDHDHETGAVRGLLCLSCNSGLGHFRDDPDVLMAAIEYLAVVS